MATPLVPEPQSVQAPEPRPVWTAPDGRIALVARDWADGHAPTYGVLARSTLASGGTTRDVWRAADAQETFRLLDALARWLDAGASEALGHRR